MKVPGLRRAGEVNAFEAYLIFVVEIAGVTVLLGVAQPTSVREALAPAAVYAWAVLLGGGGAVTLVGLFWWGHEVDGLMIKRVGLVACGFGSLVYAVAASLLGPPGIIVALYNLGFAAACWVTFRQISRHLQHLRKVAQVRGMTGG